MKTILERLQTLPEPYRSKAIHNHIKYGSTAGYTPLPMDDGTLKDALAYAFMWDVTKEGSRYWSKVYSTLVRLSRL